MVHSEQIQREVCKILKLNGSPNPLLVFNIGLVSEKTAQRWLIEREYWELAKQNLKYCEITEQLSIKYDVTPRHVKYIISGK